MREMNPEAWTPVVPVALRFPHPPIRSPTARTTSQAAGYLSYNELHYIGTAREETPPDWLASIARLHGLQPAPADRCRVLEIACGDGSNLLGMAYGLPNSTFLGFDLAAAPLAAGRAVADPLGLTNLRLEACDLTAFPADEGSFDYIVAHGIYSWCPPAVRESLMVLCVARLAPGGVAFVSFNAYPGYHHVEMERAAMLFHLSHTQARTPTKRVAEALGMLDFMAKSRPEKNLHGRELAAEREYYLDMPRSKNDPGVPWFNHDLLSEHNTPFCFHQFMEHAGAHGLQFLSESLPRIVPPMDLPDHTRRTLHESRGKPLVLEQYLDFVVNARYRQVLLCHADSVVNRTYA